MPPPVRVFSGEIPPPSSRPIHPLTYQGAKLPQEHWVHITSRYDFNCRHRGGGEISSFDPLLDPALLSDLAVRYEVGGWLGRVYASLCSRQSPLVESEARKVGLAVASIGRCGPSSSWLAEIPVSLLAFTPYQRQAGEENRAGNLVVLLIALNCFCCALSYPVIRYPSSSGHVLLTVHVLRRCPCIAAIFRYRSMRTSS